MMSRPQKEGEAAEKPDRNSKLPSERVVLLVLCLLLAAALIIYSRVAVMMANQSLQSLKEENEALRKHLSEKRCLAWEGDWEEHGGKCYYFNIYGFTWNESRHLCRDLGGDLVKIDSREEQELLMRLMSTLGDLFWIGLTDSETEGRWLWVDGSPLNESLSFWDPGQPDSRPGDPEGEDCVRMVRRVASELKTWNDYPCNIYSSSICEKPAVSGETSCF